MRSVGKAWVLALGLALAPIVGGLSGWPAQAQEAEVSAEAVYDLLQMPDVVAVLREEGLTSGEGMIEGYFPDADPASWRARLEVIYDPARMEAEFRTAFLAELATDDRGLADTAAFLRSDLGQRALKLELEARQALLDDETEEAARARIAQMAADKDPRLDLVEDFIIANDLVETNVMGALNANLAFMRGMAEGGALPGGMTEDEILTEVWSQEEAIRSETRDWVFPFLTLAYGPLTDEELQTYVDYSASEAGRRLNTVLFVAFDAVFVRISKDLGTATALQMQGQDI